MQDLNQTAGALSGMTVVDLTRILAGPWCTQMLGDFGAEVIKIERPGTGDDTRSWGPPWIGSSPESKQAAYFASANRNKKSVVLDISTCEGQDVLKALVMEADVLVENFKVGDLARYGLDYAALRKINPRLIFCSITGYGQTGPHAHRPGYDFVFQGEAGLMSVTGERDGSPGCGPQKTGVAIADLVTGLYACSAILAALAYRNRTGRGQAIDLALFDCTLAIGANLAFNHVVTGDVPVRYGNAHPVLVPYQVFRTLDGHIIVAAGNDSQWQRLCAAIERFDLARDARFTTGRERIAHRGVLVPELEATLLMRSTDEWLRRFEVTDVPHGRINNYQDAFRHPQALHRNMRIDMLSDKGDCVAGVANPVRFSETPVLYCSSAPTLGQHTTAVLHKLQKASCETTLTALPCAKD